MSFVNSNYYAPYKPLTPEEEAALVAAGANAPAAPVESMGQVAAPPPAAAPPPEQQAAETYGMGYEAAAGDPVAEYVAEPPPILGAAKTNQPYAGDPNPAPGPPPQSSYRPESSAYQTPPPAPASDIRTLPAPVSSPARNAGYATTPAGDNFTYQPEAGGTGRFAQAARDVEDRQNQVRQDYRDISTQSNIPKAGVAGGYGGRPREEGRFDEVGRQAQRFDDWSQEFLATPLGQGVAETIQGTAGPGVSYRAGLGMPTSSFINEGITTGLRGAVKSVLGPLAGPLAKAKVAADTSTLNAGQPKTPGEVAPTSSSNGARPPLASGVDEAMVMKPGTTTPNGRDIAPTDTRPLAAAWEKQRLADEARIAAEGASSIYRPTDLDAAGKPKYDTLVDPNLSLAENRARLGASPEAQAAADASWRAGRDAAHARTGGGVSEIGGPPRKSPVTEPSVMPPPQPSGRGSTTARPPTTEAPPTRSSGPEPSRTSGVTESSVMKPGPTPAARTAGELSALSGQKSPAQHKAEWVASGGDPAAWDRAVQRANDPSIDQYRTTNDDPILPPGVSPRLDAKQAASSRAATEFNPYRTSGVDEAMVMKPGPAPTTRNGSPAGSVTPEEYVPVTPSGSPEPTPTGKKAPLPSPPGVIAKNSAPTPAPPGKPSSSVNTTRGPRVSDETLAAEAARFRDLPQARQPTGSSSVYKEAQPKGGFNERALRGVYGLPEALPAAADESLTGLSTRNRTRPGIRELYGVDEPPAEGYMRKADYGKPKPPAVEPRDPTLAGVAGDILNATNGISPEQALAGLGIGAGGLAALGQYLQANAPNPVRGDFPPIPEGGLTTNPELVGSRERPGPVFNPAVAAAAGVQNPTPPPEYEPREVLEKGATSKKTAPAPSGVDQAARGLEGWLNDRQRDAVAAGLPLESIDPAAIDKNPETVPHHPPPAETEAGIPGWINSLNDRFVDGRLPTFQDPFAGGGGTAAEKGTSATGATGKEPASDIFRRTGDDPAASMSTTDLEAYASKNKNAFDKVPVGNGITVWQTRGGTPVGYDDGTDFYGAGSEVPMADFQASVEAAKGGKKATTSTTTEQAPGAGVTKTTKSSPDVGGGTTSSGSGGGGGTYTPSGGGNGSYDGGGGGYDRGYGSRPSSKTSSRGSVSDMFGDDDDEGLNEADFTNRDWDGDGRVTAKDRSLGRKKYLAAKSAKRKGRKTKTTTGSMSNVPVREDSPIRKKVLGAIAESKAKGKGK